MLFTRAIDLSQKKNENDKLNFVENHCYRCHSYTIALGEVVHLVDLHDHLHVILDAHHDHHHHLYDDLQILHLDHHVLFM